MQETKALPPKKYEKTALGIQVQTRMSVEEKQRE